MVAVYFSCIKTHWSHMLKKQNHINCYVKLNNAVFSTETVISQVSLQYLTMPAWSPCWQECSLNFITKKEQSALYGLHYSF